MDKSAGANVFPEAEVGREVLSGRVGKGNSESSTNSPGIFWMVGCMLTGMLGMAFCEFPTAGEKFNNWLNSNSESKPGVRT